VLNTSKGVIPPSAKSPSLFPTTFPAGSRMKNEMIHLIMQKEIVKVTYADGFKAIVDVRKNNRNQIKALESNQPTLWPEYRARVDKSIDKSVDNLFNKGEKRG
jgi:hypothetical protein